MVVDEQVEECQNALEKLIGKKIVEIKFKTYDHDCWKLFITTDKDELVMTFCKDWKCPVTQYRDADYNK
ncbi:MULTISPECIES: hypothetical protein [Methanobacterium]|jgi:hypothetical protein|uniref:Uncharacterized protein n=1 Tax=Methanobacterium veterum TaxID=408577 RepID=A0A9E4ZY57_9EURY|nr:MULTISPECIES: hypothetical protein [Methanobacterium]MCZ3366497.1 hypothetical protein [Methanobacterium veterum]MCZ3372005.1 hypothetical protein [Methanobacterium veterum]